MCVMNTMETRTLTMKQLTRSAALARRDAIDSDTRLLKSKSVCSQLAGLLDLARSQDDRPILVAVYSALRYEVDLTPFIMHAYEGGCSVAFPCMNRDRDAFGPMSMRVVPRQDFERGDVPFVRSPIEAFEDDEETLVSYPVVDPREIDMVVVPLVAFDNANKRLGYGGGNYDTYLPRVKETALIAGAAFSEQRVDEIPCEPHDFALAHIVSA